MPRVTSTPSTRSSLRPAHETKQDRSRRTLERILSAAEALLKERDFDELTMAELAERAGCAVGTVYSRIPNKESLLACIYERQSQVAREATESLLARCADAGLEERAREVCSFVVDHCAAQRGSIRATTMHLFSRPHVDVGGFRREITQAVRTLATLLAEKTGGSRHASPQAACEFAMLAVCDVAQSRVVFGDRSGVLLRYSRADLKARLTDLLLAYLRAAP